jgi:hypothetical protein
MECTWRDLNPHACYGTAPSTLRVYQLPPQVRDMAGDQRLCPTASANSMAAMDLLLVLLLGLRVELRTPVAVRERLRILSGAPLPVLLQATPPRLRVLRCTNTNYVVLAGRVKPVIADVHMMTVRWPTPVLPPDGNAWMLQRPIPHLPGGKAIRARITVVAMACRAVTALHVQFLGLRLAHCYSFLLRVVPDGLEPSTLGSSDQRSTN